jgi:ribosomal protein S18 acetylase RimI-like enzyme
MSKVDIHNNFIIRKYRKGDFDGIANLWAVTEMGNPKRGDNEKTVDDSISIGGSLLVIEEKSSGELCGTSWMTFDGRRIYLHHFGILPEFQGQGLSKILLKESLNFVKEKGYQVKLEVHKINERAINLYKKFGFKSLGEFDIYIIRDVSKI